MTRYMQLQDGNCKISSVPLYRTFGPYSDEHNTKSIRADIISQARKELEPIKEMLDAEFSFNSGKKRMHAGFPIVYNEGYSAYGTKCDLRLVWETSEQGYGKKPDAYFKVGAHPAYTEIVIQVSEHIGLTIHDVLLHEYAHYVDYVLNGNKFRRSIPAWIKQDEKVADGNDTDVLYGKAPNAIHTGRYSFGRHTVHDARFTEILEMVTTVYYGDDADEKYGWKHEYASVYKRHLKNKEAKNG